MTAILTAAQRRRDASLKVRGEENDGMITALSWVRLEEDRGGRDAERAGEEKREGLTNQPEKYKCYRLAKL